MSRGIGDGANKEGWEHRVSGNHRRHFNQRARTGPSMPVRTIMAQHACSQRTLALLPNPLVELKVMQLNVGATTGQTAGHLVQRHTRAQVTRRHP
jgi:hypothetical protein